MLSILRTIDVRYTGVWILVVMLIGCGKNGLPPEPGVVKNEVFPDYEVCSLACSCMNWETFTNPGIRADEKGYSPRAGDVIVWRMTGIKEPPSPDPLLIRDLKEREYVSYSGLWYHANLASVLKVTFSIHGKEYPCKAPKIFQQDKKYIGEVTLRHPISVRAGDVVRVDVKGVGKGLVLDSMQPSGGH